MVLSLVIARPHPAGAYDPPADPHATPEVRQVLTFLGKVAEQPAVLSGQFRFDQYNRTFRSVPFDAAGNCLHVKTVTGQWPAILESYFFVENDDEYVITGGESDDNLNRRKQMLAYWQNGGLVSIWAKLIVRHSGIREASGAWSDAWEEGTPKNEALKNHLDRYYLPHMAWLRDRQVAVIFRPYNEELEYFKPIGADNMKRLWIWTFRYFTQRHGLHNIIWFFAGNDGGREFYRRFPGDDYVDIVGFSDYEPASSHAGHYTVMTSLIPNKIFALAEVGWRRAGVEAAPYTQDAREIIDLIQRHMPKAAYWVSWNFNYSPARQLFCKELYENPWVLDRGEIQWRTASPPPGASPAGSAEDRTGRRDAISVKLSTRE